MTLESLQHAFFATFKDLAPVVLVVVFFQAVVLRRPFPHGRTILFGIGLCDSGLDGTSRRLEHFFDADRLRDG
jgi:hypothetical protein